MLDCVTGGVGSGIHRLRKTLGGLLTCGGLIRVPVAVSVTRGRLSGVVAPSGPQRVAPRLVVRIISRRCRVSMSRVVSGAEDDSITGPHRVTVCLYGGVARDPLSAVNSLLNKHSRSAVVRNVGGIARRCRGGRAAEGVVRAVGGGVGPGWVDFFLLWYTFVYFFWFRLVRICPR